MKEAEEKEGVPVEEEGEVVADLWTEDSTIPYGGDPAITGGGFQEKGWEYCTNGSG